MYKRIGLAYTNVMSPNSMAFQAAIQWFHYPLPTPSSDQRDVIILLYGLRNYISRYICKIS